MCKNYKLLKIIDYLHNIIIYLPNDMPLYYCVYIIIYIFRGGLEHYRPTVRQKKVNLSNFLSK